MSGSTNEGWQKMFRTVALPVSLSAAALGAVYFLRKFGIIYQLFHKVDNKTKKNGGDIVADVLQAHGVKYVFTLVGGHISPILVACEKLGIRVVDTRHEVTTVFAADAVARMSGTIGVAAVTAGPGLTNTVTAVKNAQMAESPILLIGGAAATLLKGRGALQDIDQMSLFKPLCKYCASVTKIRDIVPTLKKALYEAQSGTPGPVFVEFPIDTLYPYELVKREIGMKDKGPVSLVQRIINWYLMNHLNNLFAGAFETRDMSPLPVNQQKATPSQVQKSIELITKAKRPVVLVGSQATLPPVPVEKLRKALEDMGIPCFLGGMARGLLGRYSGIQARQKRGEALKEADVVIMAGAVADFRLGYGRVLNKRSKIITINRSKEQLYKNSDMFWKPTVAIEGDVASFIVEISQKLQGYKCDPDWIQKLKDKDDDKEKANRVKAEEKTDQHLNPLKVLHIAEEVMSDDTVMVADGGDFVATAAYILRPRAPLHWLDPGAFGTLGVGGGFALGAKLCRPDSDVWIIYGDGSLGYSVAEIDTFTRHKIPVIALVGNDAGWTQIEREQAPMFGSSVACKLAFTDYETVAIGYGGKGLKLDRSNEDKIREILKEAIKMNRDGNSVLINVLIGKTNFREGSISV
ncbi:2-hydroxyacyl-CoA lyase 2-like isoform X1 [Ostrea edulis]|uniref:2-hydroxyacyl-CoA lyase 2-like isoform X1 n=1 Tax=Ostrea edulis TaxID=37623 RepID=UPI0024AF552B|nr:2-hydroxyacyl-CoA lyase 2-like isoform X1 [Ostrea edulis]